ncbi:MAG: LpxI family protein [Planctomycetota bacterium]
MATLAIIAGWGRFPFLVAESAKKLGHRTVVLGLEGEADPDLARHVDAFHPVGLIQLGKMARLIKQESATLAVMAGGVRKDKMFARFRILRFRPDLTFLKLWFRALGDKKDATILLSFGRFLEEQGARLLPVAEICPELLGPRGPLAGRAPTAEEEADLAFGFGIARELARLDIGQTVLVKERAVIAVESIEGTDAAIRRAGELCRRGGFSLVKVARPAQDMRFDVPTIGPGTVDAISKSGGRAIAYEASRTLVLDVAETITRANEKGIVIVGLNEQDVAAIEERHGRSTKKARGELGSLGDAAAPDPGAPPS